MCSSDLERGGRERERGQRDTCFPDIQPETHVPVLLSPAAIVRHSLAVNTPCPPPQTLQRIEERSFSLTLSVSLFPSLFLSVSFSIFCYNSQTTHPRVIIKSSTCSQTKSLSMVLKRALFPRVFI